MKSIFIGGSGRSGTSLVQKILIIHSKIAGTNEFDFLEQLMPVYRTMSAPRNIKQKNYFSQTELDNYWKEFLENLFSNVANKKEEAVYFSEKTPYNIFVAKDLLDLFPDAKFIYVYRDGRDVVSSFKQVEKRYRNNKQSSGMRLVILTKSIIWLNIFNAFNALYNNPKYKDRIYVIRYEDLVSKPLDELKRLMAFLDLELEQVQLDPSLFSMKDFNINTVDNHWYNEESYTQKINTGNIDKWKKDLSLFEKFIVNTILAKRLKQEGYPVNSIYLKLNWLFFKVLNISKINYKNWR
jgi:hypothetical protein